MSRIAAAIETVLPYVVIHDDGLACDAFNDPSDPTHAPGQSG